MRNDYEIAINLEWLIEQYFPKRKDKEAALDLFLQENFPVKVPVVLIEALMNGLTENCKKIPKYYIKRKKEKRMEKNLQIFKFQEKEMRTAGTIENPLFCAKDVCEMLDLEDVSKATSRLREKDSTRIKIAHPQSPTKTIEMLFVTESGLYRLVLRSNKTEAEVFQDWITDEVLPAIRKYGMYATDDFVEQALNNPDVMITVLQKFKEEKERRVKAEKTVTILTHVNKTYTTTEIAKELGLKSAIALNNLLAEKKIQFKQNNTWVMYSKYADRGFVDIKQEVLDNGHIIYHRKWTGIGREWLLELLSLKQKEA